MLKNLLAATAIIFAFATSASAQNKYFLTYYNKAEKLYEAKDYINVVIGKPSKVSQKRHNVYADIKYFIQHGFIFLFEPKL